MTRCDYCRFFEGKGSLQAEQDRFGDLVIPELFICEECLQWLNKILSVRTRYVQMVKELKQ